MKHRKTQTDWEVEMCQRILRFIHDELYFDYRFLDVALSTLLFCKDDNLRITATDGIHFFYPVEQILRLYPKNPLFLNRAYLHSVMHCVFKHLWLRKEREPFLWGLAADIAVEWMIDHAQGKSTRRILSRCRMQYYTHLQDHQIPVTAAAIYQDLLSIQDPKSQQELQLEFLVDDHRYWPKEEQKTAPNQTQAANQWDKISRQVSQELERRGRESSESRNNILTQIQQGKNRRSYRDFLKKFMILREELICDDDAFDLTYYTYGLQLYKNMPLIEPLESREVMKILNFVIVIDTSFSTNGTLVQRFLEETYTILTSRDSFFHKSQIHLLQCDDRVQRDLLITSMDDLSSWMENFELCGGGGTDFRPAFHYINQKLEEGSYPNVKGVLYFTDGKGRYPAKRPAYDTAFIFVGNQNDTHVPVWAMKLELDAAEWRTI